MLWMLAAIHFAGFSCSTESDTLEGGRSSQEDCSSDGYCTEDDELCWTGEGCDTTGCSDEGDDVCHKDCTIDEECGGSEECTFVGDDVWLCI